MKFNPRMVLWVVLMTAGAGLLASCGTDTKARASSASSGVANTVVGVNKVNRRPIERALTVSAELVPFQETDVYAKESGYVRQLNVDYGSRVKAGQVMAVLEIPELQLQLQQDDAAIKNVADQVTHAEHEVGRVEAQHKVLHLQFERLDGVSKSQKGLVAQQEVDDAQGKDLAAEAQVEATKSNLEAMKSQLAQAQAKRERDQVLFDYSKITAPFAGVVTQRYANLGTLMQSGTNSSTQAMPLVRISEDDLYRLVIPIPESYVRFIRVGDPVKVNLASLNRTVTGTVKRFSMDVREDTRTMHTEVDVPNQDGTLIPGLYAEAVLTLEKKPKALVVPLTSVGHDGDQAGVDVVTPSNQIEVRKVTLGLQTENNAEVLSGVKEGDMVVVSDRSGLKAGQQVQPQETQVLSYEGQEKE